MDADGDPDLGPQLPDARGPIGFLWISGCKHHQGTLEPGVLGARYNIFKVGVEDLIREMTVGVDHAALNARGFPEPEVPRNREGPAFPPRDWPRAPCRSTPPP